jgi:Flp pilus assembly protein TadD
MSHYRSHIMIGFFLVAINLVVYGQVIHHKFINYDDNYYVTSNQHVLKGWTPEDITWAFTTTRHGHWHPLTWLSHITDCELFGLNPAGHHLTSLILHIASTLLLFLALRLMTGALYRSAIVAALFAVHPLHVEPVAWVAGRKDVLSTLFWMLAMIAYARYSMRPGLFRYLLVLMVFALGLMAKSMVVTLPLILLLMDYWPLGRFTLARKTSEGQAPQNQASFSHGRFQTASGLRLISEKALPFAMLAASAVTTLAVMKMATKAAFGPSKLLPSAQHLAVSIVFYVEYIVKMFWPAGLALPYPHPGMPPIGQVIGAIILLGCISFLVIRWGRRYPYLPVGWLWYLVTLLPVIGLIDFGPHEFADRYSYVPLIGLFIIVAWGSTDFLEKLRLPRLVSAVSAGTVILVLMICAFIQVGYWKDSLTVFGHSVSVTTGNYKAQNNLGLAFEAEGKLEEAVFHYSEAIRIRPSYPKSHANLAMVLGKQGKISEALPHFIETVRITPNDAKAQHNLGITLARLGRLDEAIAAFSEALRFKPDYAEAHNGLGAALASKGRLDEAASHFSAALRIKPDLETARKNLDHVLQQIREAHLASDKAKKP